MPNQRDGFTTVLDLGANDAQLDFPVVYTTTLRLLGLAP